jgi:hypothetical protein
VSLPKATIAVGVHAWCSSMCGPQIRSRWKSKGCRSAQAQGLCQSVEAAQHVGAEDSVRGPVAPTILLNRPARRQNRMPRSQAKPNFRHPHAFRWIRCSRRPTAATSAGRGRRRPPDAVTVDIPALCLRGSRWWGPTGRAVQPRSGHRSAGSGARSGAETARRLGRVAGIASPHARSGRGRRHRR